MKLTRYLIVSILLIVATYTVNVNAQEVQFSIGANYSWGTDNTFPGSTKTNSIVNSIIFWTGSTSKSSHKMWFRVMDSYGKEMGRGLLEYITPDIIRTYAENNETYYLQARREHILNSFITVTGSWNV